MAKVFKKTSGSNQLTLLLGKRDYVDHVDKVDTVEGVVKIDPAELGDRKVWVQLCCAFRYGRDDLDVIGLSFRRDIWIHHIQLYPDAGYKPTLTEMHDTLLKKSGEQSYPFTFEIPTNLPCSVTLQPGPDDKGKPCGVDFEVKTYMAKAAEDPDEKIEKKDTARLVIRKIQFAPDNTGSGQKAEICKSFMMSDKPVLLEASLDKDIYYHGEAIPVKVKVKNDTNKVVKKIKITIDQTTDVILYSADKYTKNVLTEEFNETVEGNATFEKTLPIIPLLANNKEKRGLSLDGRLKEEDTNLASTTVLRPGMDKEVMGILVSYKIKVNLMVSGGGKCSRFLGDGDLTLRLVLKGAAPFSLLWSVSGYLHLLSLCRISISDGSAVLCCSHAFAFLLSWIGLKDRFMGVRIVAAILSITGIVMLAYADGFHSNSITGVALGVGSASTLAFYKVLFRKRVGEVGPGAVCVLLSCVVFNVLVNLGGVVSYPALISLGILLTIPASAAVDWCMSITLVVSNVRGAAFGIISAGFLLLLLPEDWDERALRWFGTLWHGQDETMLGEDWGADTPRPKPKPAGVAALP
ncbi:hypothetical protein AOLI_G00232420 [Acnodon oligacanthus]